MTVVRFELHRHEDPSGISGLGCVVEGARFSDGTCATRWLTATRSSGFYDSLDDVVAIHGHNGATVLVVHDNNDGSCANYDGAMADLAELVRLARTHINERRATDDTTAFVDLATHIDLNYPERNMSDTPWQPPRTQPGDRILSAFIIHGDQSTPIKVLARTDPATGSTQVSGYNRPLDLPAGAHLEYDIPAGDPHD